MHTDPIADLLTRIRNATKAHHEKVTVSYSKMKENILKVMREKGFIEDYMVEKEENGLSTLTVTLKETKSDIQITRKSSPGQRLYVKKEELKPIKSGLGITIISTSKGVMSNMEARKLNLGGEIICEIF